MNERLGGRPRGTHAPMSHYRGDKTIPLEPLAKFLRGKREEMSYERMADRVGVNHRRLRNLAAMVEQTRVTIGVADRILLELGSSLAEVYDEEEHDGD